MHESPFHGATALITGASTGIGAAIADRLAGLGLELVLVARSESTLGEVAAELARRHGVVAHVLPVDLGVSQAVPDLLDALDRDGLTVDVLVNNAGVAATGLVVDADPGRLRDLVDLNVAGLTDLTVRLLPPMIARGHGAVVNVASTAAFQAMPYQAVYAASKAYVLSFTRALWGETEHTGVRVVAVSPGPTRTSMNPRGTRTAQQAAETVVRALHGSGPDVVDGRVNIVIRVLFGAILPVRVGIRLMRRLMSTRV